MRSACWCNKYRRVVCRRELASQLIPQKVRLPGVSASRFRFRPDVMHHYDAVLPFLRLYEASSKSCQVRLSFSSAICRISWSLALAQSCMAAAMLRAQFTICNIMQPYMHCIYYSYYLLQLRYIIYIQLLPSPA